jgi:hypothetical protein
MPPDQVLQLLAMLKQEPYRGGVRDLVMGILAQPIGEAIADAIRLSRPGDR